MDRQYDFAALEALLKKRSFKALREALLELNEVDIAEFLGLLNGEEAVLAFRTLPKGVAADVFAELEPETQQLIVAAATDAELAVIVEDLYVDDAVDMLEDMPANVVKRILKNATPEMRGLINQFLRAIGLEELCRTWTADPDTALGAVIVTNTWRYAGFTMVLYYVAMLDIPKDVLESAQIDGANRWHLIRYFYLPLTRGTTEINLILTITGCLRAFDIFYLLTSGGPGTSTKVVSMWIMETAFQSYKYGRALAMSIVLFVIVVFTMVIFRLILTPREKE